MLKLERPDGSDAINRIIYHDENEDINDKIKDGVNLIYTNQGSYKIVKNELGTFVSNNSHESFVDIVEGIKTKKKIPFRHFVKIYDFCSKIYLKHKTEAAGLILLSPDGEFETFFPKQNISGAHVSFDTKKDKDLDEKLNNGYTIAMEAHSHPWSGSPTPSGVDNKDENKAIYYMIVGDCKNDNVSAFCSTCPSGSANRLPINFFEIFESSANDEINALSPELAKLLYNSIDQDKLLTVDYKQNYEKYKLTDKHFKEIEKFKVTKPVSNYGSGLKTGASSHIGFDYGYDVNERVASIHQRTNRKNPRINEAIKNLNDFEDLTEEDINELIKNYQKGV